MVLWTLLRFQRRMQVAALAIGLCVAFIIGSFAFAKGLDRSVETIGSHFISPWVVVTRGETLTHSAIALDELSFPPRAVVGRLTWAEIDSEPAVVVFLEDPEKVLTSNLTPVGNEAFAGQTSGLAGSLEIVVGAQRAPVFANRTFSSELLSPDWLLVSLETMGILRPDLDASTASFLLLNAPSDAELASFEAAGLQARSLVGILGYLHGGTSEVSQGLWLVVAPSALIIAILVYGVIAMELADRRRELAILKTIGAGTNFLALLLLVQALLLALAGGLLGIVLGIITAYGVATLSSAILGSSLFILEVTELSFAVALIVALVAGLAGALLPIRAAMRLSVREALA